MILDLDETLIHCDFNLKYDEHSVKLQAEFDDGTKCKLPIIMRPFLAKFLEFARKYFEVVVYTASDASYADHIINYLDPIGNIFSNRLYRTHFIQVIDKIYTKPLKLIENRKLENIIVVDNSIYNFAMNLNNGYLISSFYNDKYDTELLKLEKYLKQDILECEDVRTVNIEKFKF